MPAEALDLVDVAGGLLDLDQLPAEALDLVDVAGGLLDLDQLPAEALDLVDVAGGLLDLVDAGEGILDPGPASASNHFAPKGGVPLTKRQSRPPPASAPEQERHHANLDDLLRRVETLTEQGETIMSSLDGLKHAMEQLKQQVAAAAEMIQAQAAQQGEIDQLEQEAQDLTRQLEEATNGGGGGDQGGGDQGGGDQGGGDQPSPSTSRPSSPATSSSSRPTSPATSSTSRPQQSPAAAQGGRRIGGT